MEYKTPEEIKQQHMLHGLKSKICGIESQQPRPPEQSSGMFLFQVGVPSMGHIHYAVLTQQDATDLIQNTNSSLPVSSESQPSVIISSESNGNSGQEHVHALTVYFDYVNHTFIVTDITNNSQDNHEAILIGAASNTNQNEILMAYLIAKQ